MFFICRTHLKKESELSEDGEGKNNNKKVRFKRTAAPSIGRQIVFMHFYECISINKLNDLSHWGGIKQIKPKYPKPDQHV